MASETLWGNSKVWLTWKPPLTLLRIGLSAVVIMALGRKRSILTINPVLILNSFERLDCSLVGFPGQVLLIAGYAFGK